ncbi:MAG: hypothetical protein HFE04_00700 [Bacilli bacterium]|nr:hypothetical protein [Bacilli bacterium]
MNIDMRIYSDMLDVKETLERFLSQKTREFTEVHLRLRGISNIVSVDDISILVDLDEIKQKLDMISADYLKAKTFLDSIKNILSMVNKDPDSAIEKFDLLKAIIKINGIIKNPNDDSSLRKKI